MWDELKRRAGTFTSAVLSAHDADGYPASVRTSFAFDEGRQAVRVEVPASVSLQEGVASLLFHSHDEQLWSQEIVLVRGELIRAPHGWVFRPLKLVREAPSSPLGIVRFLRQCRKTAKAYLKKRGVQRPAVPWAHLRELKGKA